MEVWLARIKTEKDWCARVLKCAALRSIRAICTCSCCSACKRAADDSQFVGKFTVFKWRLTSAREEAMKAWKDTPHH